MTPSPRPARWLAVGAALLVLSGCGAAEPTLDERIDDLETAIELYRTVPGAECDEPSGERTDVSAVTVDCEDGATIVWSDASTDDEFQRKLTSTIMAEDHGIDAVVGVNVTIMNVDPAVVAQQIGGSHP